MPKETRVDKGQATITAIDDRVVIRSSRTKLILIVVGALLFVALGAVLIYIADEQNRYPPIYVKAVSVAAIGFFGLCGIFGVIKLFDSTAGLVLDRQGILDNSSGSAAGRVEWRDVRDIQARTISGQKMLAIIVDDPEKFLDRGNFVRRFFARMNYKYYGTPVFISAHALKVDFEELEKMVRDFQVRYGTKENNLN